MQSKCSVAKFAKGLKLEEDHIRVEVLVKGGGGGWLKTLNKSTPLQLSNNHLINQFLFEAFERLYVIKFVNYWMPRTVLDLFFELRTKLLTSNFTLNQNVRKWWA